MSIVLDKRASELYEEAGNPRALWHAEDQSTRNYYLKQAVKEAEAFEALMGNVYAEERKLGLG